MALPLTLLDTSDMDREQWLKLRKHRIGGSDVAAICGLSRWKSPMHVYLDKIGQAPEEEVGEAAYWGTVMEDVLAQEFAKRTSLEVRHLPRLMVHPEHDWAAASVDRLIVAAPGTGKHGNDVGILECKTASEWLHHEWQHGKIPDYYMLQLQWYFGVSGLTWGYFATLVGGNKFYYYEVERDDALVDELMHVCGTFWDKHIIPQVPPQFDGSDASTSLLKKLYPSGGGNAVQLGDDAQPIIHQLLESKRIRKEAETLEAEAENRLKAMMETGEVAYFQGKPAFTWKEQTDTRLDSKTLQAECPEIYEKYVTTKSIRKFLPKIKEV